MTRNNSYLMVGQILEYHVGLKGTPNITEINDQLESMGLKLTGKNHYEASVNRLSDDNEIERYKAFAVEWSGDDEYHDAGGKPWHVCVGKVLSKEHGAVDLETILGALEEIKEDFPDAKVLHCTQPRYIDNGY